MTTVGLQACGVLAERVARPGGAAANGCTGCLTLHTLQVWDVSNHRSVADILTQVSEHFRSKSVDSDVVERTRVVIFASFLNMYHGLQVRLHRADHLVPVLRCPHSTDRLSFVGQHWQGRLSAALGRHELPRTRSCPPSCV